MKVKTRNNGISFAELHSRLSAERATHVDAIVDTSNHVALDLIDRSDGKGKDVGMLFMTPSIPQIDGQVAPMTDYMHGQLASRTGIDKRYYDRMRQAQPSLLMKNVETWWAAEPEQRLVRAVQPARVENGQISIGRLMGRAWLSDRYRTLDNYDFVMTVLETAGNDAVIESCFLDDERVYLKLVCPEKQGEIKKGDVVQAGVIVKNSEVGDGKVLVQPFAKRLVCLNGLIRPEQFGQVHLGAQNELGILQQDTLQADAKSVWLQVRDWVKAVLNGEFLERTLKEARQTKKVSVEVEARQAVANIVRDFGLNGFDGQGILDRYLRGNDETQFGMVNAITQYAHEGQNNYRRQVELESFGGTLMSRAADRFSHMVSTQLSEEQITKAVNA